MYLSIIILPLLGSIVSGFFGRKVGVRGAQIVTCSCVIVTTILAFFAFVEVGFNNIPVTINLFRWIDSEWINIMIGFQFDSLTVSMLLPVLIISSLVHIYSIGYMSGDPHNQRFFSYLSLFTFMMVILVTGNNYLLMFVGWEGVGVCSYLLVSFWFTRIAANQSSISAFLTNRVGDCFLTIGMIAVLWSLGNLDYSTVFSLAPYVNDNVITFIGICLVIGAMAKSSQVGLHVWLPMAMEGPTPVSALIHAATMVTAGVYLLMRSSPLIEYSSTVLLICLWLGAITTVFSSLVGYFQQDIKKVIAYSTMSQLGLMVVAIGLSSYNIALFHLINHAFYKAALFLGAGSIIHAVADNQDFRKYGGLLEYLPLTYSVILIASLSLAAFPFMTGFYSKDLILESAFGQFTFSGISVYVISTVGAIFTTLYSVKVLYLTFLANPNGSEKFYNKKYYSGESIRVRVPMRLSEVWMPFQPLDGYGRRPTHMTHEVRQIKVDLLAHEGDIFLILPLVILAIFSIFFGYLTKDLFLGLGTSFFSDNAIFVHPSHESLIDTEFAVPTFFKLLPFLCTILFIGLAIIISENFPEIVIKFKFSRIGYNLFGFFNQRFLVEMFYTNYIINLVLDLGGQTTKVLDKGSVELIGPYGLEKALINISKSLTKLSTGKVTSYALYILVGFILYVWVAVLGFAYDGYRVLFILLLISAFLALNVYKEKIRNFKVISRSVAYPSPHLQFSGRSLNSGMRSSPLKVFSFQNLRVRLYSTFKTKPKSDEAKLKDGLEQNRLIKSRINSSRLDSTYKLSLNKHLCVVRQRGKVVNSFTYFSRFNGLSGNGIMIRSQLKYKTASNLYEGFVLKGRSFNSDTNSIGRQSSLFSDRKIIDNLINKFNLCIVNKGLNINKDTYCLIYNQQLTKEILLKKYPEILEIEFSLNEDFDSNNLIFYVIMSTRDGVGLDFNSSLEDIKVFIKKNNKGVIIPEHSSFLKEKKSVLDWLGYNTPTFKDPTITPLVGTNLPGVDLDDQSPSSIYQQWLLSLYMLTWEFNILNKAKLYLEHNCDLYSDINDIKDKNTIYWLNRQLRLVEWFPNSQYYIEDFYSNKFAFYRVIYEDITYVLLNIILGKRIIDAFVIDECISSDKFFTKLTEIIREHYIEYSEEYKYLEDLRWYLINHCMNTTELLKFK